ncbi:hypothetical protein GSI_03161 [Ganoderma sinense ZZ0214-1]|uniref:RNase H type-1 domain-containing protein n=1 Tax=Ganoderma sinense ZZ0214-1 TaxID=1077348 RepID=A0A2G8SKU2_9APHY|nr:hypothetical protein GSI_03161 [Ganoderma sinense ZZ0214-1]
MIKHLGFLLDKKLSFREHIKHYASKGNVTALAYRMLGTSIRGLTAFQRRKLFISCIRPILTYGSPVWYRPTGGKILTKPLVTVQNTAMRWITGTFCYTPSGFLPIVSALEPLHAYLQKLRKRYLLRIHTLMDSHPIRSLFPNLYKRSYHSPYIRFYPTPSKPKIGVYQGGISSLDDAPCEPSQTSADGDISYFHDFPECADSYNPLDDECRPGARIIDIFRNRITLELQHPPKSDAEILQKWIQTVLTPRIRAARDDPTRLHAFTDGSASSKGGKSSAGYILFHGPLQVHQHAEWCGRGFSFDAERTALLLALKRATTTTVNREIDHIQIFSDSESMGQALGDVRDGNETSLQISRTLRAWFNRSPRHRFTFTYVPSHSGVQGNEAVDELVGKSNHYPAYWRTLMSPPADTAQMSIELHPTLYGKKHSIIKYSRFCRALCGHAPTGLYRMKMRSKHNEPINCPCGVKAHSAHPNNFVVQDTEHILQHCPLYGRRPLGRQRPWPPSFLEDLDPFPKIFQFLTDNPTAFSFADVPDSDSLNHHAKAFWRIAGSLLWHSTINDPDYVLSDMPDGHPITPHLLNDHDSFKDTFYQDFAARKQWAILAYNNHVILPTLEMVYQEYVSKLQERGHYDDLTTVSSQFTQD